MKPRSALKLWLWTVVEDSAWKLAQKLDKHNPNRTSGFCSKRRRIPKPFI